MLVKIADIIVPENRQRKEFLPGKLDDLTASFLAVAKGRPAVEGQLQPIIVTKDLVLVAGERRLRAMSKVSDVIKATVLDAGDPVQLSLIELEENVKRVDLHWQEYVTAVTNFHYTQVDLQSSWNLNNTAASLNIGSTAAVSRILSVGRAISAGDDRVLSATSLSAAYNIVERQQQRALSADLARLEDEFAAQPEMPGTSSGDTPEELPTLAASLDLGDTTQDELEVISNLVPELHLDLSVAPRPAPASPVQAEPPPPPEVKDSVACANFLELLPVWPFGKFNLLHCDFPYGVNHGKSRMGNAAVHGGYEDSPETYWELCEALAANVDKILQPSAHVMFWFSFNYYSETVAFFRKKTDLVVQPFPLIWAKSSGQSLVPDASRQPRRGYESALLMSRGDRKIVQTKSNIVSLPAGKKQHLSQKPNAVLSHFFHMLVDGSTELLDPTCGSGTAITASLQFSPARALGIELNCEYADVARTEIRKYVAKKAKINATTEEE